MQKNMRCVAGTCADWIDTLQRYHMTGQKCLLFVGFTALEEMLIVHPGKNDKPPLFEDPWAPWATRPVRDIRNGPSLSPQGQTGDRVMEKQKKVVGFEGKHVTHHGWLSWEGTLVISMPGLLYTHVLIIRD